MYVCMQSVEQSLCLIIYKLHLIFQRSTSSTKSTFLGKSLLGIEQSINYFGCYVWKTCRVQIRCPRKKPSHCLLLTLIHRSLNYPMFPRRQGIGIFSSSRMGCLQDHSRSVHFYQKMIKSKSKLVEIIIIIIIIHFLFELWVLKEQTEITHIVKLTRKRERVED